MTRPSEVAARLAYVNESAAGTPTILTLHPTDRCNHSCEWCWFDRTERESDIEGLLRYIDYFAAHGLRELVVSGGGEPTLYRSMPALVDRLGDLRGVNRRLYTNGSRLDSHGELYGAAFDFIRVSLDAVSDRTYAKAHGVSSRQFHRVLESLKSLRRRNGRLRTGVSLVYDPAMEDDYEAFVSLCAAYEIDDILIKPRLVGLSLDRVIDDSKICDRNIVVRKTRTDGAAAETVSWNSLMASRLLIGADNGLYPCCHLTDDRHRFGYTNESPGDLLESDRWRATIGAVRGSRHACFGLQATAFH